MAQTYYEEGPADRAAEFMEHSERFCSVKEAAGRVRKSVSTILRAISAGEISAVRVGRTLWVYVPSLRNIIRNAE